MPNEDNKILKYDHGEKSLKDPFMIYAGLDCFLEKCIPVKIILKNLTLRKKLSIRLLVIHCLQIVHLMKQKTSLIVTKAKAVWKGFFKDIKDHAMKIINYQEEEMIPLTDKGTKSNEK